MNIAKVKIGKYSLDLTLQYLIHSGGFGLVLVQNSSIHETPPHNCETLSSSGQGQRILNILWSGRLVLVRKIFLFQYRKFSLKFRPRFV